MVETNTGSSFYDEQKKKDDGLFSKEEGRREKIKFGLEKPLIAEDLSPCDLKRLDTAVMILVEYFLRESGYHNNTMEECHRDTKNKDPRPGTEEEHSEDRLSNLLASKSVNTDGNQHTEMRRRQVI